MLALIMFLLMTGLLNSTLCASTLPTKEEQVNLLTNVQEVFEQLKHLVSDECVATDASVVGDVDRMANRATERLSMTEQLALIKLTCTSNAVCMLDGRPVVHDLARAGVAALKVCTAAARANVTESSRRATNATNAATGRGQLLLNALHACSRKAGLLVISCYRTIIASDVVPVKKMLLAAIDAHRQAHLRAIQIRNEANECVDSTIDYYQTKIEKALNEALKCV